MTGSEDQEQAALFQWAATQPVLKWLHAIPNGGHRHIGVARKLKAQGVKSGVWDVFLPVPMAPYHGLYIEMKVGRNKLTENQVAFGEAMRSNGYRCVECYGWPAAKTAIEQYLSL